MQRTIRSAAPAIIVVALLSGAIAYLRSAQVSDPVRIAAKGADAVAAEDAIAFVFMTIVGGLVATAAFVVLSRAWSRAALAYAVAGIGVAAVLSLYAFVAVPRAAVEFTAINAAWGLGFGLLLPRLLERPTPGRTGMP